MSHVPVGERLVAHIPNIVEHVIVNGGHYMDRGGYLVQQISQTMESLTGVATRGIPYLTTPASYENWQWNTLASNYGQGSFIAGANHESSAAERSLSEGVEKSFRESFQGLKDLGLAIGSAFAGDQESAVAHGAGALEHFYNSEKHLNSALWGSGPTPGQGTCPMPGEGRPD